MIFMATSAMSRIFTLDLTLTKVPGGSANGSLPVPRLDAMMMFILVRVKVGIIFFSFLLLLFLL